MSAAQKAAAKALALTYENSYHAERELRQALADLLAEQTEARNTQCFASCPKTPVCDETYPDPELPDHCERCHHPLVCHSAAACRPAPSPVRAAEKEEKEGNRG